MCPMQMTSKGAYVFWSLLRSSHQRFHLVEHLRDSARAAGVTRNDADKIYRQEESYRSEANCNK